MAMPHTAILALAIASTSPPSGDINILSRLELLCKDVGRPLLMTGAFAAEVAAPVFEIGHFELRGFRQHQSLYGLCQDGEVPAAPDGA
jgi:adenylate cyclase